MNPFHWVPAFCYKGIVNPEVKIHSYSWSALWNLTELLNSALWFVEWVYLNRSSSISQIGLAYRASVHVRPSMTSSSFTRHYLLHSNPFVSTRYLSESLLDSVRALLDLKCAFLDCSHLITLSLYVSIYVSLLQVYIIVIGFFLQVQNTTNVTALIHTCCNKWIIIFCGIVFFVIADVLQFNTKIMQQRVSYSHHNNWPIKNKSLHFGVLLNWLSPLMSIGIHKFIETYCNYTRNFAIIVCCFLF